MGTPKKKARVNLKDRPKKKVAARTMLDDIIESRPDEQFLKADGFDAAVIGLDEKSGRLIYSVKKCLEILAKGMSGEEAREYFDFNVSGAYMGEKTPIWCEDEI